MKNFTFCILFFVTSSLYYGLSSCLDYKRKLKILVDNPAMAYSHMQFQGKLADVLAEAGHEVHVLMLDIDPSLSNFNASYKVQRIIRVKRPAIRMIEMQKIDSLKRPFTPEYDHYEMWRNFMYFMETICEDLLENKDLLEHLKAEKYDVGITEFYDPCTFGIFHHIGVKTQLASLALQLHGMVGSVFGIPTMSSYVPNFLLPPKNMPMNFKERAYNFYADLAEYFTLKREPYIAMQFLFDEAFGVDFPSLKDIARNVSLVFVNANEFNSLAQPLSNKIVFIGGIVRLKPNALNEHLQVIFNKSNKGVVLCSFGSHPDTRSMSENLKKAFLATFSSFPDYDFILKWTLDQKNSSSFDAAPNVHVFDWLDQKAILNQPKLVAFMSHCGLNSLTEAANAGVPIVGMPLFGDQQFNAALINYKGMGEIVDIRNAEHPQKIIIPLAKVLHNPQYKVNCRMVQRKLQLSPFSPEDKLVKWVEFAAEYPNFNELNLPSEDLNFCNIIA